MKTKPGILFAMLLATLCSTTKGANYTVNMSNYTFVPKVININVGDTITWANLEAVGHDTVSGTNKIPSGLWSSPLLANHQSWSFTFTNVAAGNYTYYCTPHVFAPYYMTGLVVVAESVANVAPTVSITSPVNSAVLAAPATFTIDANADDTDGTVSQVEFFNGANSLGVATSSPYSVAVNELVAGNYTLSAVATDDGGAKATNSVDIVVDAQPTIALTGPANNTSFTGPADITLEADAADTDGTISQVDFYSGTTLLGTAASSPYTFNWSGVPAGTYSLTAKATDDLGITTTSAVANIDVTKAPASAVTIASPTWNGTAFTLKFPTAIGYSYSVEYTDALTPIAWQALTNFDGDGTTVSVTNLTSAAQRIYRVGAQ